MSDLIDRQEAIKAIHNEYDEVINIDESGEWIANDVEEILRWLPPTAELRNAPSAEPRWIPTAERLPEEDGHYIVTFKNGWFPNNVIPIDILLYEGGKWKYYFVFEHDDFGDDDFESPITAWMPLPEPYQSEEGQE